MDDYNEHSELSILEGWGSSDRMADDPFASPPLSSDELVSVAGLSDEEASSSLLELPSSDSSPVQVF